MPFAPDDLAVLEEAEEIEIETRAAADAPLHRTIIWVVTDGPDAFIRSVRGAAAPLVSRGDRPSPGRRPRRPGGRSPRGSCRPRTRPRWPARAPPSSASTPAPTASRRCSSRTPSRPPCGSSPPEPRSVPMYLDEFKHQLPDIDSAGDRGLAHLARPGRPRRGREPGTLPHVQAAQARPPAPRRAAAAHPDPLHQHDQPRAGAVLPGRRGASSTGSAGSSAGTPRRWSSGRTPSYPGIGGHLATYASAASLYEVGFNHFFRGKDDGARRPDLLPGSRGARHVRAGVPRGPPDRGPARPLPARGRHRATGSRPTRTRGSCPTSGSSRR